MLPTPIDLVGFFGGYFVMMMLYNAMNQSNTHSLLVRLLAALLAYSIIFFLLDYFLNFGLLTYEFFTATQYMNGFLWIVMSFFTGFLVRWYVLRPEKFMVDEMKNFIWISLTFGNYFRLKDVDTQERIGTYKMKKLFQEVHGRPFTKDVIATAFDQQVTTFKKVPVEELQNTTRHYPPEFTEELAQLRSKQRTDVSASFTFELMDNRSHPFLVLMEHFVIEPTERILSFEINFPSDKTVAVETEAQQTLLVERIYLCLQVLIDQEWFGLYTPFFGMITILCKQKEFNVSMHEIARPLMTISISLHNLQIRANKITTGNEIVKIARIQFF